MGSSPATPTKKTDADRQGGVGFSIGRDSNPERAKSVKKAAGGRFFSFLVRRRVPKCEAFGSSSSGDAQSAAPSRHSDHVGMDFAPFRFFFTKNQSYAPSFLLCRKKARSARLFACKRSQRLTAATTFLRVAPAAQIPRQGGVGFSIGRDSNPERAKSVKKAAGGSFFSFGGTKTESFRRKND